MTKEEVISGMEQIMNIALYYANPCLPDYEDWELYPQLLNQFMRS